MAHKKNRNNDELMHERPLEYWEKSSYLIAIPKSGYVHLSDDMRDRVESIENLEVKDWTLPDDDEPGHMVVVYDDEEYEVGFYFGEFALPEMFSHQGYYFTDDEMVTVQEADRALTMFMEFGADSKKSYHLQLKLLVAMVSDLVAIMDESAERLVCGRWARLAAESSIVPGPESLFMVQAVAGDDDEVWLHTHGLNRCGLYELEIVDSDKDHYNNHYSLLNTLACHLLDGNKYYHPWESFHIGMLNDKRPVVATYVPWTEGLKEYEYLTLGGVNDRKGKGGHGGHTALVFLYKDEDDEANGRLSKVSEYNDAWSENTLFFISTEETLRMSALARERFGLVRYMANKKCDIIVKIGLKTDTAETSDEREHIWFRLIEIDEERFRAQLIQEPYNVSNMHEGDEDWYTIDDVTDWTIYLEDFSVTPNTAYMLI